MLLHRLCRRAVWRHFPDACGWISCRPKFFLPFCVELLIRRLFLIIWSSLDAGDAVLFPPWTLGGHSSCAHGPTKKNKLEGYAKHLSRAEQSQYVARTPIECYSNARRSGWTNEGSVSLEDYVDTAHKDVTLAAEEFIRTVPCFTVLPEGFQRDPLHMFSHPLPSGVSYALIPAALQTRRPLPTLKSKKITVTGTKRSQACP